MGQVRLIPPMMTHQRTYQNNTGISNGGNVVYPIQFTSYPVYTGGMTSSGGYVQNETTSLHAHVALPTTITTEEMYNPLQSAVELYSLGYKKNTHSKVRRKGKEEEPETVFHMVQGGQMSHMFWDYQEIEDYVEDWTGDLLVSINANNMSSSFNSAMWSFAVSRMADAEALKEMLVRKKSLSFECSKEMREKFIKWLDQNTTEYELIEDYTRNFEKEDLLYIRSDTEAVHFKMRWFGVTLEDELELENED